MKQVVPLTGRNGTLDPPSLGSSFRVCGGSVSTMAPAGILIGRFLGEKFGRVAEAIGGFGLIVIGLKSS